MKIRSLSLALLTSLVFSVGTANADIVAIDFGATAPATANYNQSSFAGNNLDIANLVRLSDGASTGISLTVGGDEGVDRDNTGGIAGNGGNTTDSTIFVDGVASVQGGVGNNVITFTFGGLDDSITYDLVGGTTRAQNNNLGNFETDWTTSSTGGNGATTQNSVVSPTTGYVNFTDLTSTNGSLTITVTDATSLTAVSQIELSFTPTSVPEPSSVALVGLAGIAFMSRRRK